MTDIRDRILAEIEVDTDLLSEDTLLSTLLDELRRTKAALKEAQIALIKEGMRADEAIKRTEDEFRRMKTDPMYAFPVQDLFFVATNNELLIVRSNGPQVQLMKRMPGVWVDYLCQEISREQAEKILK